MNQLCSFGHKLVLLSIKQNVHPMRFFIYVFTVVVISFSSCSYKPNQTLFEQTKSIPDSIYQKSRASISNYRIRPHDILQIRNIQESKNLINLGAGASSQGVAATATTPQGDTYEVDDDGTIALTGLGRVQIGGLTRVQVRNYIEELYNKKFLKDALFDVKLLNLKVTVLGEVRSPGNYILIKDNTKLLDILGEAGGLTDKADEKTVKIIRGEQAKPDVTVVDLSNTSALNAASTFLTNNDLIYVGKNRTAIRTEKTQTFSIFVQPVILVINTVLILFTLARR